MIFNKGSEFKGKILLLKYSSVLRLMYFCFNCMEATILSFKKIN